MNKIKQVREHSNTNVRLMVSFLEQAMKAVRAGNIEKVCTNVRLARKFEEAIPRSIRLDGLGNV